MHVEGGFGEAFATEDIGPVLEGEPCHTDATGGGYCLRDSAQRSLSRRTLA